MHDNCVNHTSTPAQWICPQCDNAYCNACISKRPTGLRGKEFKYFCPKCNVEAEWIGVANLIPPFWMRLHLFFVYPFHPAPLTFLIITSLVFALLGKLYFVGWLIQFFCTALCLKYAFEALKATGRGKLVPPKVDIEVLTQNFGQVFQQFFIIIVLAITGYALVATTGMPNLILPYIIFILFFYPSIIILQVATGSVLQAVNPVSFVQLAWRIGPGYLLMCFFLILMMGAPAVAGGYVMTMVPSPLQPVLLFFSQQYYLIVMYHLMGYVLLQYHNEIGYEVSYRDFEDVNTEEIPVVSPEVLKVDVMIQEGKIDDALAYLGGKARMGEIQDLELAKKYYGLLNLREMLPQMLEFSGHYLRLLLQQEDKEPEAVQVYQECRELNPLYLPKPDLVLGLGDALEERGLIREALALYDVTIKKNADHPSLPEVYFRAARILNERMTQPDQAREILYTAQQKFQDDPIQERVTNYLKVELR